MSADARTRVKMLTLYLVLCTFVYFEKYVEVEMNSITLHLVQKQRRRTREHAGGLADAPSGTQ